jgi:hypothetical protein
MYLCIDSNIIRNSGLALFIAILNGALFISLNIFYNKFLKSKDKKLLMIFRNKKIFYRIS